VAKFNQTFPLFREIAPPYTGDKEDKRLQGAISHDKHSGSLNSERKKLCNLLELIGEHLEVLK
jgi:hypothetical protein